MGGVEAVGGVGESEIHLPLSSQVPNLHVVPFGTKCLRDQSRIEGTHTPPQSGSVSCKYKVDKNVICVIRFYEYTLAAMTEH